jgi:yecA family protein
LNKRALQKLDNMLDEKLPHIPGVPFMHGYFSAILVSPKMILPSQFLPVLGIGEDSEVDWQSEKQMQMFFKNLFELYNDVAKEIQGSHFEPLLSIDTFGVNVVTGPFWWCKGFMAGLKTANIDYEKETDKTAMDSLIPILFFAAPPEMAQMFMEKNYTRRDYWATAASLEDELGQSVINLRNAWRAPAQGVSPVDNVVAFPQKEPARNQPCPCGSGKKYKNCCGKTK